MRLMGIVFKDGSEYSGPIKFVGRRLLGSDGRLYDDYERVPYRVDTLQVVVFEYDGLLLLCMPNSIAYLKGVIE